MDAFPENLDRFEHAGVVFDGIEGVGAVPDVQEIAYLGFVVLMRPSVFLSLCPPIPAKAPARPFDCPIGVPFLKLDIETPDQVRGHEGRHRMSHVLAVAGDDPVPVAVFPIHGKRARHVTEDMVGVLREGIRAERSDEANTAARVEGPLFDMALLEGQVLDFALSPSPSSL